MITVQYYAILNWWVKRYSTPVRGLLTERYRAGAAF